MSQANPVPGTLTGTPGAGALPTGTSFVLLTLVLPAASWIVLAFPTLVQAGDAEDGTPLWSADISVVDLVNGATGAVQPSDFSNQAGSAGLTAKWLYHYEYDGKLRLSFTEGADVEGHLLQVGHLTLSFAENTSGNSPFTWDDVDVDWEAGQTLAARVATMTDGNIPFTGLPNTGLPKVTGRPQVDETLTADTSDNEDQDGLDSVSWTYQWQSAGADIALATGLPTISGAPQADRSLTADTSPIDDEDGLTNESYRYKWSAGGSDIDGATGSTYTLTYNEQVQTIQVRGTFTDDAGNEETLTGQATVAVAAAPNLEATGKPAIGGNPQVGQTLAADTSPIDGADGRTGVSYRYRWLAGGSNITGGTGTNYILTASEEGQTVKVKVSFQDDAGNQESLGSLGTHAIKAKPEPLTASFPSSPFQSSDQKGDTDRPQVIVAFSWPIQDFDKATLSVMLTGPGISSVNKHTGNGLDNARIFFLDPEGNDYIFCALITGRSCDSGGICASDGASLGETPPARVLPGPEEQQEPEGEPGSQDEEEQEQEETRQDPPP